MRHPAGHTLHLFSILRPVMQCFRIKVRPIGPDQRVHFRVYLNLIEHALVLQRCIQSAFQNRSKVNDLLCLIVERNPKRVQANDFTLNDPIDWMVHVAPILLPF
jgi:hypothetical protein